MLKVAEIINCIKDDASKKGKEETIRINKDNKLFTDVLHFIFNPYIKTNIATKKLAKKIDKDASESITSIYHYMDYLKHSTGKDDQIVVVQDYIASQPVELHWILEAMATKTLKIGATASTMNKALGEGFIPTFDLMLAEKYIETKKIKGVPKVYEHWNRYIGKRVIATKKLDGNRVAIFVRSPNDVKLYTREGHVMEGFHEIEKEFSRFPIGRVYDGELLATNEEGLNSQDLFTKTSKIVKKKGIKTGLEFHAFDTLPIDDFEKGGLDISAELRKEALEYILEMVQSDIVKYVEPTYIGLFDFDLIEGLAQKAKDNEEEGIMVQLADAPYSCKRVFDILKVKSFESADIRCLDIYEGKSGKNIGRLGGLVLDFKGHRVNVGGGFSDELRVSIWEDPSQVIGKIVEIKYFEEFESDDGSLDLRFATFKDIRTDKSEPSYY